MPNIMAEKFRKSPPPPNFYRGSKSKKCEIWPRFSKSVTFDGLYFETDLFVLSLSLILDPPVSAATRNYQTFILHALSHYQTA